MDIVDVQNAINRMGELEGEMEAQRDQLNLGIRLIRDAKRRLGAQLGAVVQTQDLNLPSVAALLWEATGYLVDLAREAGQQVGQHSALGAEQVSLSSGQAGVRVAERVDLRPAPPPQAVAAKKKKVGVHSVVARVLSSAFSSGGVPETLEDAFVRTYGPGWENNEMTQVTGFQSTQSVTMEWALREGALKSGFSQAARRLHDLHSGVLPEEVVAPNLRALYYRLRAARDWLVIEKALEKWNLT